MLNSFMLSACCLLLSGCHGMATNELAQLEQQLIALSHALPTQQKQALTKEIEDYINNLSAAFTSLYLTQYREIAEPKVIKTPEEVELLVEESLKKPVLAHAQIPASTKTSIKRMFITAEQETRGLSPLGLSMCRCLPIENRITFILQLLSDVKKTFPDTDTQLVYTSLASGSLLHDYLFIRELIEAGYNQLHINVIDISYPARSLIREYPTKRQYERLKSLSARKATLNEQETQEFAFLKKKIEVDESLKIKARILAHKEKVNMPLTHEERELLAQLRYIKHIEDFQVRLEHLLFQRKSETPPQLTINFYENPNDYISRAQRIRSERTNILVMVDPGDGLMSLPQHQENYLARANTFIIGLKDSKDAQQLLIFMPLHGPMRLYSNVEESKLKAEHAAYIKEVRALVNAKKVSHSNIYKLFLKLPFKPASESYLLFQDLLAFATAEDYIAYEVFRDIATGLGPVLINKRDKITHVKTDLMDVLARRRGAPYRLI